jgi:hypothetical protein
MTAPVLDAQAFPHIVSTIIEHAPFAAQPALRSTCRAFKKHIDELQSRVIVSFGPGIEDVGEHIELETKEAYMTITAARNGMSGRVYHGRKKKNKDALRVLRAARVVDIKEVPVDSGNLADGDWFDFAALKASVVRILAKAQFAGDIPPAEVYVLFPCSVDEGIELGPATKRVVFHVDAPTIRSPLPFETAPPFLSEGIPAGAEIVLVLPAWKAGAIADLDKMPDHDARNAFLENTFSYLSQVVVTPHARHTIVNFDAFAQPLIGRMEPFWPHTFEGVMAEFRVCVQDQAAGLEEDEVIEKMVADSKFSTLEEWRATLGEDEWGLFMAQDE